MVEPMNIDHQQKIVKYECQLAVAEDLCLDYNRAISVYLEGRGYTVK